MTVRARVRVSFAILAWAAAALGSGSVARASDRGCFETHLRDAIELNQTRVEPYAEWSNDESRAVSRLLISSEKSLLPLARLYDRKAQRFQKHGVSILCDELIPMSEAPRLEGTRPPSGPLPDAWLKSNPARRWTRSIRQALRSEGFAGAFTQSQLALDEAKLHPSYLCMARHILESIARAATLAPIHARQAQAKGLPSTEPLSKDFIRLQLWGLEFSTTLDRKASPLQAQGVPIVCNDVPPIPYR